MALQQWNITPTWTPWSADSDLLTDEEQATGKYGFAADPIFSPLSSNAIPFDALASIPNLRRLILPMDCCSSLLPDLMPLTCFTQLHDLEICGMKFLSTRFPLSSMCFLRRLCLTNVQFNVDFLESITDANLLEHLELSDIHYKGSITSLSKLAHLSKLKITGTVTHLLSELNFFSSLNKLETLILQLNMSEKDNLLKLSSCKASEISLYLMDVDFSKDLSLPASLLMKITKLSLTSRAGKSDSLTLKGLNSMLFHGIAFVEKQFPALCGLLSFLSVTNVSTECSNSGCLSRFVYEKGGKFSELSISIDVFGKDLEVGRLTDLQELSLNALKEMDMGILQNVVHLTQLSSLKIGGCMNLGTEHLELINRLNLQFLDLSNSFLSPEVFQAIGQMPSLKKLILHLCTFYPFDKTCFSCISSLRYLIVDRCMINEVQILEFIAEPSLRQLILLEFRLLSPLSENAKSTIMSYLSQLVYVKVITEE